MRWLQLSPGVPKGWLRGDCLDRDKVLASVSLWTRAWVPRGGHVHLDPPASLAEVDGGMGGSCGRKGEDVGAWEPGS